jgi:hypothetical protein
MTLADVLAVVSGLALGGAGFASFSIVLLLISPRTVDRAAAKASERPGRSLLSGVAAFLLLFVGVTGLLKAPGGPKPFVALVFLLGALTLAAIGGAGLAAGLGRRWRKSSGEARLTDVALGALLLEGAAALPLVGWFVVAPAALLFALGTGLRTVLFRQRRAELSLSPTA